MIEEKTRRSKTNRNKEVGVCAKSVQSPIVLLQRLHIGGYGSTLIKAAVTDKLSISVKCDKTGTSLAEEQKSKKCRLRNSSAAILNDLTSNDKPSIQCTNPKVTAAASQSIYPDLDAGNALSKTTSFKYKKKLKRLEKTTLDMVTDKKLSEKITDSPKLSTDISAAQKTKISITVSTRKKQAEKAGADDNRKSTVINDSELHTLKTNSSQEQVSNEVPLGEQVFDNSKISNGNSAAEKTAQVKPPMPTRNKLLRRAEVDDCMKFTHRNSLADSSTSNISQLVNGESLSLEKESHLKNSNSVDNSARNTISTRNKLRQVNKTDKSNESALPLKISNRSSSIEKIEKLISVGETADTIKNNDAENTIKTRSKVHEETKAGNIESPSVAKSRLKKINNKSALTGNVVVQPLQETDLAGAKDNNNIKKPIPTRSRLSDAQKTDNNNESFVKNETIQLKLNDLKINLSRITTSNKSESVGNALDNLKLTADTTMGKETSMKSTISASKLQVKVIVEDCENLKIRESAVRNKNAELIQSSSPTDSSQTQTNGHSVTSNILENGVVQPSENNSTSSPPHMQIDDESSINGSVLDRSMSTVGASIIEAKITKGERISTRSKTSATENNILQPEKVQSTSTVTSEKSLTNAKINDTPKSVAKTLKAKESNDIPTRSRSLEKVKSDDNKKLTIEKSSENVTIQPEENQKVSTPNKIQINNEISNLTRSPKKINTARTSTISKIEKKKTDVQESSIAENETVHLEPNQSTPESATVQTIELTPNDTVQHSLKLAIDSSKTKESTPTGSKSHEKKKESEKKSPTADENTFSTKSKMFEKNKKDDHVGGNLEDISLNLEKRDVVSDLSAPVVISNKPVETENIVSSPKQLVNSTKSPKKVEIKITRSTRSKLFENNLTDNHEKFIVENGVTSVQQTDSSSSPAKNKSESVSEAPANVDNSSNTISTRSGLTRKPIDAKSQERKTKSLAEKSQSPFKSQEHEESIAHKKIAETISCDMKGQQRVCYGKEVVIKLFRCDQAQPVVNRSIEEETSKKKSLRGKRKAERETTAEETSKAKKSKLDDSSKDLPITNDNQSLAVDQVQLSTSEDTGKSAVDLQNNVEPDISDKNVAKGIENVSENHEETEKDSCPTNSSDINTVDNTIIEKSKISKKETQCDTNRVEKEKEIIVNSSGDNISVHGDELLEDRDEGISVDTSENEANVETPVISDNLVVKESPPTTATREKESQNSLARRIVEEVMNDWDDDDKTDDIDSTGVNQDVSTPVVIQINDNDDVEMIADEPEEAVNIENAIDKRSSQNGIAMPRKNVEVSGVAVTNSPRMRKEKRITVTDVRTIESNQSSNTEKETRGSTSEQTSEMSEFEEVDDSNFESVDEISCTEAITNENSDEQEDNVSQETITYYNSEDISMEVGVSINENRLNDVVMNLKDACDKITADLRRVNTSYENNEETPNHQEPEVLCISDDSNDEQVEEEEEVMIIEPTNSIHEPTIQIDEPSVEIHEPEASPSEQQQNFFYSNPYHHVMHQGSPSISVIKASELRDDMLQPPVEYPAKPTESHVVYPQRQMMHSTTLLPASMIPDAQTSSVFTEDTIMQCPKCRCDFVGKSRLRRHWLTCGDAMYLYCPFCTNKVKQRRSLINHLNTQHADQVNQEEAAKITEQIVKQTREAAGVKLKQGSQLAMQDFLHSSCPVPMIELPSFIRIQCVVCNKLYDEVPATYKKTCDDCSSDLMTAICQLCRKQYMLSSKIALHVQGNCIYSGRVTCRECGFESSGRYHLQEHIIRKHIYVAPEDYHVCSHGCGKTFRVYDQLRKHERLCAKESSLDCKYCDYKTKHRSAMTMHVQQHIEKANDEGRLLEGVQADEDVRDLITEQQVRSVIRVHCSRCNRNLRLTSNRSSCEYCKLSFTFSCSRCSDSHHLDSLHAARLHVIRSHSVKVHECPHCSEKFSYVYDLTRHASKCTAKFGCDYCNYRTNHENKIRDHTRRVHPAALMNSLHCIKCGKWFTRLDSLRRHELKNCGILPSFSCEHCQFKTKTKYSLLRHIQKQHAYIYEHFSFVCNRCDKFYNNMFAYEVHVKNCHALASN